MTDSLAVLRSLKSTHAANAAQAHTPDNAAIHRGYVAALDAAIAALAAPAGCKELEWALRTREAYHFTENFKNRREYRDAAVAFIEAHATAASKVSEAVAQRNGRRCTVGGECTPGAAGPCKCAEMGCEMSVTTQADPAPAVAGIVTADDYLRLLNLYGDEKQRAEELAGLLAGVLRQDALDQRHGLVPTMYMRVRQDAAAAIGMTPAGILTGQATPEGAS